MNEENTTISKAKLDKLMKLNRNVLLKEVEKLGVNDKEFLKNATKKELSQIILSVDKEEIKQEESTEDQSSTDPIVEQERPLTPTAPLEPAIDRSLLMSNLKESGITPNASLSPEEKLVRDQLWSEPLVSIMIPLEQGEDVKAVQPVIINGYRLSIPKNTMVKVPQSVAEMIAIRYKMQLGTGALDLEKQFDLNRNNSSSEALN